MALYLFICALLLPSAAAQQLLVATCYDGACSNCTTWVATQGACKPCSGSCSASNPSTVVSATGLRRYSDASCSGAAALGPEAALTMDGLCKAWALAPYASYQAKALLNSSAGVDTLDVEFNCNDFNCKDRCAWSWFGQQQGACLACKTPPCSAANPSVVVSNTGVTLFSDSKCTPASTLSFEIPVVMDGKCQNAGDSRLGRYVIKYVHPSLPEVVGIIVGSVGGALVLLALICCAVCKFASPPCCKKYCPSCCQRFAVKRGVHSGGGKDAELQWQRNHNYNSAAAAMM